jgi:hypothetical protein
MAKVELNGVLQSSLPAGNAQQTAKTCYLSDSLCFVQVLCFTRYVRAHGKECREKVKRAEDKVEQAKRELGQRAKEDRLLFSGALGVSVLAIIELLHMAELNSTLSFSLHFFAISIPLCAMGVVLTNWLLSGERTR